MQQSIHHYPLDQRRNEAPDVRRAAVVALANESEILPADVRRLRRAIFADGSLTRDEADALFALDASRAIKCAEWLPFFVEAITDHIVWQARPTGVVNEHQGEWLLTWADRSQSVPAFAALVNVLAEAHRVPLWFVSAVRSRAARGWPGLDEALLRAGILAA